MIESKDFASGCLAIVIVVLCLALIPILIFFFKLSFVIAIPLVIIAGVIIGVAVLGKVVRKLFGSSGQR